MNRFSFFHSFFYLSFGLGTSPGLGHIQETHAPQTPDTCFLVRLFTRKPLSLTSTNASIIKGIIRSTTGSREPATSERSTRLTMAFVSRAFFSRPDKPLTLSIISIPVFSALGMFSIEIEPNTAKRRAFVTAAGSGVVIVC